MQGKRPPHCTSTPTPERGTLQAWKQLHILVATQGPQNSWGTWTRSPEEVRKELPCNSLQQQNKGSMVQGEGEQERHCCLHLSLLCSRGEGSPWPPSLDTLGRGSTHQDGQGAATTRSLQAPYTLAPAGASDMRSNTQTICIRSMLRQAWGIPKLCTPSWEALRVPSHAVWGHRLFALPGFSLAVFARASLADGPTQQQEVQAVPDRHPQGQNRALIFAEKAQAGWDSRLKLGLPLECRRGARQSEGC